MAWSYADWRSQATAALRLARLNLHMAEVAQKIGNERGGDGYSVGSGSLAAYLRQLEDRQAELEKRVERTANGGAIQVRMIDPADGD